ncbi:MAG TPA: esterase-like activity of phytase family protein [Salinimicrobium sp.]|nr:esterase-like activity of phytase family protein [Salinimicrobium sp.]
MKRYLTVLLLLVVLSACKSTRIGKTQNLQLQLLDDYIIPKDLKIGGTLVGGLSGIEFHDGKYYLVSDHPSQPRFYQVNIELDKEQIDTIIFEQVILIDQDSGVLKGKHLDLEGIIYNQEKDHFVLSSEGSLGNGKDPAIFKVTPEGAFIDSFAVPQYFMADSRWEPRNNGVFEGLAQAYDKEGIWTAMELPLKSDGPKPKLYPTKSPVRITLFDEDTQQPVRQFAYLLESITKIPWLYFAINGVSDMLQYAPDKFLILERGFSAGHGSDGNIIRIFDVDASLATNTLNTNNLKVSFYNPAKKELVYDFKWAKDYLSRGFIDNIEGITFGPILPNGNQSILLISDNNFNSLGEQINQVVLMEFTKKK